METRTGEPFSLVGFPPLIATGVATMSYVRPGAVEEGQEPCQYEIAWFCSTPSWRGFDCPMPKGHTSSLLSVISHPLTNAMAHSGVLVPVPFKQTIWLVKQ